MPLHCLSCGREFPEEMTGEIEVGGMMLCLGCGHVMCWTETLQLRELTEAEHEEAGHNFELMRMRNKVIPRPPGIQFRGSWAMTLTIVIILVMLVLEHFHVTGLPDHHHKQIELHRK